MSIVRQLLIAELIAIGWLAVCALVFAWWVSVTYSANETVSFTENLSQVTALAGFFFAFGILPVILYGAPAYVWLQRSGSASWWSVLVAGLLPGAIVLPSELSIGVYALVAGGIVSLLTDSIIGRRPNNSFMPSPHQVR